MLPMITAYSSSPSSVTTIEKSCSGISFGLVSSPFPTSDDTLHERQSM